MSGVENNNIVEKVGNPQLTNQGIMEGIEADVDKVLKYPSQKDIPSDYFSWEKSSLSKGSRRDVKYAYGEGKDDIIGAVLVDYSYYPGGGCGMEYGVKIFVKRGDKTDYERIVYRDSYSSARDDWGKAYTSIDGIEVTGDEIRVKVSSSRRTDTCTFYLKKSDKPIQKKEGLSLEQQAKFKKFFESEKDRLIEEQTRHNGRYPVSYDLTLRQIPNAFGSDGIQPYDERPYDKAEVVDKFIDVEGGTACIVIKTQINADAISGKQYAWLKYKITQESTELVDSDNAYQSQLLRGKEIKIRAN